MERSVVRVWIAGKERPAIILEVRTDFIRVLYGTTEPREWPGVEVNADTRQGRRLDLREATYFYGANTSWERAEGVRTIGQTCSWELFFALRQLVEDWDSQVPGRDD